jgi:hypothetical protein
MSERLTFQGLSNCIEPNLRFTIQKTTRQIVDLAEFINRLYRYNPPQAPFALSQVLAIVVSYLNSYIFY